MTTVTLDVLRSLNIPNFNAVEEVLAKPATALSPAASTVTRPVVVSMPVAIVPLLATGIDLNSESVLY